MESRRMIRRQNWRRLSRRSGLPCSRKVAKLGPNKDERDIPVYFPFDSTIVGADASTREIMVRRLNFPGTLQTEDPEQYSALVEALGGDDHGGTRLWWDTGNNNLNKKKKTEVMCLYV